MDKKLLLEMRPLHATATMIKVAKADNPRKHTVRYSWGYSHQEIKRDYDLYLRCAVERNILKVALYAPDGLRAEGRCPSFEVYIDKQARDHLTYDKAQGRWLTGKVNRLPWPNENGYSPKVWASKADEKAIQKYLGGNEGGYNGILAFQREIGEERLERRYRKVTDPWDKEMALIPPLPKDWDHWVNKVGIPHNYIFYDYVRGGAKHGFCSYCGKEVPIHGKPKHGKSGHCPCCRHKITYKAKGRFGWFCTPEACVYLVQPMQGETVVREFWAFKKYSKETYRNPEVLCFEHWRLIYSPEGKCRTYYWGNFRGHEVRWIAGQPSYSWMGTNSIYNSHGSEPGRVYGKTLPHLRNTALKKTGLIDWIYHKQMVTRPDQYLDAVLSIPQVEQLWKVGLYRLAELGMHYSRELRPVLQDPAATSLTKALGIGPQALARLRAADGSTEHLAWLQYEKLMGKPLSDELIQWYLGEKLLPAEIEFIADRMSVLQVKNYLIRQSQEMDESIRATLDIWKDYLSMAKKLDMDTQDEIVYRVSHLQQRHDEVLARLQRKDNEDAAAEVLREFPRLNRICRSLKKKYEYIGEKYSVLAPASVLDILVEGDVLHHCVGSSQQYWDRIDRHETYILFLRKTEALEAPYYTLEVEPDGTIRQNRTKYSRRGADISEITEFLHKWQQAVTERLTKNDRKRATKSRILRNQEFETMRKDDVRIRAGDLAGHRLVDVLTADLMENQAA